MLRATVALLVLCLAASASCRKHAPAEAQAIPSGAVTPSATVAATASAAPPPAAPVEVVPPDGAKIEHIMISYKGAMQAEPDQKRTKEQAKKLAKEIAGKIKKGQSFDELAKKYSDDKTIGLGILRRDQMLKPFAEVVFDLKAGGVSDVVETGYGFHVIRRVE